MDKSDAGSKPDRRFADLADQVTPVGMILKSQGAILRGWEEVKHSQLSHEDVAGLGDLLQELGERLCKAANGTSLVDL